MAVWVVLRPRPLPVGHRLMHKLARLMAGGSPPPQFSDAEFRRLQAPDPEDVRLLTEYAAGARLTVVEQSPLRHDVVVAGPARRIEAAFGVELEEFDAPAGRGWSHRGEIQLPRHLHDAIVGVLGLDTVPRHRPHVAGPAAAPDALASRSPLELAEHYRFPRHATGRGQRIAILSFGGGFHAADLDHYFRQTLGLAPPRVRAVALGRAGNAPMPRETLSRVMAAYRLPGATVPALAARFGDQVLARAKETLEVTMDIQIAAAVAPRAAIDVLFAEPGAAGFYEAIYTALGLGRTRCQPASVISISWGMSESGWSGQLDVIDAALRAACLRGVTVVCSSGDFGSLNQRSGEVAQVNFPASSPHVLAVGGTSLQANDSTTIETVWNRRTLGQRCASGGGVSGHWPRPPYQRRVPLPRLGAGAGDVWIDPHGPGRGRFRGVPDVAAVADLVGGCRICVGGVEAVGAGTSAAAPLWAGLIARLNEAAGRSLGWLTPLLYRPGFRTAFHDVRLGHNRVSRGRARWFRATRGWDGCTGLGSPVGERLLARLVAAQRAGRPRAKRDR